MKEETGYVSLSSRGLIDANAFQVVISIPKNPDMCKLHCIYSC